MGRLIEAEALLRDMVTCCASTQFGRATAKMCIKRAPTVDAVEVVRCHECRFNSTCERIVKIVPKNSKGGSVSAHLHGCEYGMRKDGGHTAEQNTLENAGKAHRDTDREAGAE